MLLKVNLKFVQTVILPSISSASSGKEISKAMESDEKSDLTKELIETFKKSEIWKDEQLQIEVHNLFLKTGLSLT